jgi:hypothetical protein
MIGNRSCFGIHQALSGVGWRGNRNSSNVIELAGLLLKSYIIIADPIFWFVV